MTSKFFLFALGNTIESTVFFCIQSPSYSILAGETPIFSTHFVGVRVLPQDDCAGLGVLVHAVANQQHVLTEEPLGLLREAQVAMRDVH